jgi:hypothetical protein
MYLNVRELCILPTERIYVFHVDLLINSNVLPKQHFSIDFCSEEVSCFL